MLLDIEIHFENDQNQIILPDVINPNEFSLKAIRKTLKFYIREKLAKFVAGIILICIFGGLFPFISSDL